MEFPRPGQGSNPCHGSDSGRILNLLHDKATPGMFESFVLSHFIEGKTEAPQPQIFACGAWRASGKAEVSNLGILGLRFAPSASHVHIQEQCEARAMPSLVLSRMRQSRACPRIAQAGDRRLAEPDSILVPTGDGLFDLSQVT